MPEAGLDKCASCTLDCELKGKGRELTFGDLEEAPKECPHVTDLDRLMGQLPFPALELMKWSNEVARVAAQYQGALDSFQRVEPILEQWDQLNRLIANVARTYYPSETLDVLPKQIIIPKEKPHRLLLRKLDRCPRGRTHWRQFQDICTEILVHLFVPPLEEPFKESRTKRGHQRRDLLFPIPYDASRFWAYIKSKYNAEFLVVDAKNYSKPIRADPVVKVANYLGEKRLGNFALILSRLPPHESAQHACEQLWRDDGKMILPLCDADLKQMMGFKEKDIEPERLIDKRIKEFLASLF